MFKNFMKKYNVLHFHELGFQENFYIGENRETGKYQFFYNLKEDGDGLSCGHVYDNLSKMKNHLENLNSEDHFCQKCGSENKFILNLLQNHGSVKEKIEILNLIKTKTTNVPSLPTDITQQIIIDLIDQIDKKHEDLIYESIDLIRIPFRILKEYSPDIILDDWKYIVNALLFSRNVIFKLDENENLIKSIANYNLLKKYELKKDHLTLVGKRLAKLSIHKLMTILRFFFEKKETTIFEIRIMLQLMLLIAYNSYYEDFTTTKIENNQDKMFKPDIFHTLLLQYFIVFGFSFTTILKKDKNGNKKEINLDESDNSQFFKVFKDIKELEKKTRGDNQELRLNPLLLEIPDHFFDYALFNNDYYPVLLYELHVEMYAKASCKKMWTYFIEDYPHLLEYPRITSPDKFYGYFPIRTFQENYIFPRCFHKLWEEKKYNFFYRPKDAQFNYKSIPTLYIENMKRMISRNYYVQIYPKSYDNETKKEISKDRLNFFSKVLVSQSDPKLKLLEYYYLLPKEELIDPGNTLEIQKMFKKITRYFMISASTQRSKIVYKANPLKFYKKSGEEEELGIIYFWNDSDLFFPIEIFDDMIDDVPFHIWKSKLYDNLFLQAWKLSLIFLKYENYSLFVSFYTILKKRGFSSNQLDKNNFLNIPKINIEEQFNFISDKILYDGDLDEIFKYIEESYQKLNSNPEIEIEQKKRKILDIEDSNPKKKEKTGKEE